MFGYCVVVVWRCPAVVIFTCNCKNTLTLDLFNVIYTGSIGEMEWGGEGGICTTERNKHHMTVHSMYFMQNYVMNVYNILKVIWPKSSRWSLYWEEFSFLKKRLQYLWKYLLSLNQTLSPGATVSYIQTSRLFWP